MVILAISIVVLKNNKQHFLIKTALKKCMLCFLNILMKIVLLTDTSFSICL